MLCDVSYLFQDLHGKYFACLGTLDLPHLENLRQDIYKFVCRWLMVANLKQCPQIDNKFWPLDYLPEAPPSAEIRINTLMLNWDEPSKQTKGQLQLKYFCVCVQQYG